MAPKTNSKAAAAKVSGRLRTWLRRLSRLTLSPTRARCCLKTAEAVLVNRVDARAQERKAGAAAEKDAAAARASEAREAEEWSKGAKGKGSKDDKAAKAAEAAARKAESARLLAEVRRLTRVAPPSCCRLTSAGGSLAQDRQAEPESWPEEVGQACGAVGPELR